MDVWLSEEDLRSRLHYYFKGYHRVKYRKCRSVSRALTRPARTILRHLQNSCRHPLNPLHKFSERPTALGVLGELPPELFDYIMDLVIHPGENVSVDGSNFLFTVEISPFSSISNPSGILGLEGLLKGAALDAKLVGLLNLIKLNKTFRQHATSHFFACVHWRFTANDGWCRCNGLVDFVRRMPNYVPDALLQMRSLSIHFSGPTWKMQDGMSSFKRTLEIFNEQPFRSLQSLYIKHDSSKKAERAEKEKFEEFYAALAPLLPRTTIFCQGGAKWMNKRKVS